MRHGQRGTPAFPDQDLHPTPRSPLCSRLQGSSDPEHRRDFGAPTPLRVTHPCVPMQSCCGGAGQIPGAWCSPRRDRGRSTGQHRPVQVATFPDAGPCSSPQRGHSPGDGAEPGNRGGSGGPAPPPLPSPPLPAGPCPLPPPRRRAGAGAGSGARESRGGAAAARQGSLCSPRQR